LGGGDSLVVAVFCVVEFLVGILGRAVPYLELGAIGILAAGTKYTGKNIRYDHRSRIYYIDHLHVHAFGAIVERDGAVRSKLPLLVGPATTIRHYDRRTVLIVSAEAFCVI
jgi:hypothetical protein